MKMIDLAEQESASSVPMPSKKRGKPEPYYPSLYLRNDALKGRMPGTKVRMVLEGEVTGQSMNASKDGPARHTTDLKLRRMGLVGKSEGGPKPVAASDGICPGCAGSVKGKFCTSCAMAPFKRRGKGSA